MKKLTYIILLISLYSCNKLDYSNVQICNRSLDDIQGNKLVMLSDSECGYCQLAYKDIAKANFKNLSIVIVDYSSKQKGNNEFVFVDGNECNKVEKPDFFPQVFLFNKENKLIWKKRGWFDENIEEIKNRINSNSH